MDELFRNVVEAPDPYARLYAIHIAAGVFMILGSSALFVRKGGVTHQSLGFLFLSGLSGASLTVLMTSIWRLIVDPRPAQMALHFFFIFLAVTMLSLAAHAAMTVAFMGRLLRWRFIILIGPILIFISGVVAQITNLAVGHFLFGVFPITAYPLAISMTRYYFTGPRVSGEWKTQHRRAVLYTLMGGATSLTATIISRLTDADPLTSWRWLLPLAGFIVVTELGSQACRTIYSTRYPSAKK